MSASTQTQVNKAIAELMHITDTLLLERDDARASRDNARERIEELKGECNAQIEQIERLDAERDSWVQRFKCLETDMRGMERMLAEERERVAALTLANRNQAEMISEAKMLAKAQADAGATTGTNRGYTFKPGSEVYIRDFAGRVQKVLVLKVVTTQGEHSTFVQYGVEGRDTLVADANIFWTADEAFGVK